MQNTQYNKRGKMNKQASSNRTRTPMGNGGCLSRGHCSRKQKSTLKDAAPPTRQAAGTRTNASGEQRSGGAPTSPESHPDGSKSARSEEAETVGAEGTRDAENRDEAGERSEV